MSKFAGIDISDESVRVAVVRSTYRQTELVAFREELIASHPSVHDALRMVMADLRVDASAVCLSGAQAYIRRIALPATAQRELASILAFEVEATLPFELDDAVVDHRILSPRVGADEKKIAILAGVGHTEHVREVIALTKNATGLDPHRVGVGPLPLANLATICPKLRGDTPVLLIDFGTDRSDILVIEGGEPQMSRTLSRGVRGLPETAEGLIRELRQTLAAWRAQGGNLIGHTYVLGDGGRVPGLEDALANQLGVPCDSLSATELQGISPDQGASLARFAKALGLALGLGRKALDLNLRQGALQAQQSYQFLREKTPLLAGLAAALLASFGFSLFAEVRALDKEREQLESQLEATTEAYFGEATKDPTVAAALFDGAISGKRDDPLSEIDAFDFMVIISERIPETITHDIQDFEFRKGQVTIKGVVPRIEDAHAVAKRLGEHECISDVKIIRTTQLKGKDRQKYALELTALCHKKEKKKKKGGK